MQCFESYDKRFKLGRDMRSFINEESPTPRVLGNTLLFATNPNPFGFRLFPPKTSRDQTHETIFNIKIKIRALKNCVEK